MKLSESTSIFTTIRNLKNSKSGNINSLKVGDNVYVGESVPDGFFASLSALKSPDMTKIHSTPQYQSTLSDFQHILKISRSGDKIPAITPKISTEVLLSLKNSVNAYYSVTASHFTNAGKSWLVLNKVESILIDCKLCNNVQLKTAQLSCLGADLGSSVVSAIGQADDTVL